MPAEVPIYKETFVILKLAVEFTVTLHRNCPFVPLNAAIFARLPSAYPKEALALVVVMGKWDLMPISPRAIVIENRNTKAIETERIIFSFPLVDINRLPTSSFFMTNPRKR